ncbi:transcription elongation factor B polypeptide 3 [Ananas comosus]|uniref:Transcription elongation factor B polypeptide 3 n=2 Tax=Ananas comosus TaxID=4615 RepID=A0A6P5F514_ANACO|nr:transcription elongation factor B polypeptide 3 [Ananas comosus]CAD1826840.1 unnamed protein product [Ananas comosus var. bracteatus]
MEHERKRIPTLVELCTRKAIDNLRYLGDVGELDLYLLKDIVAHCTVDQLAHIENSTKGRDLSPVTDSLWKRFYEQQFGVESTNLAIKRMKQKHVFFKWKQLYEAKTKEREEAQNRVAEKLKQRYAESLAQKQSRQIRICSKIPPSGGKRSFWGGGASSTISNFKSPLMKKAKIECLNSPEAKIHATMRKNALQRNNLTFKSAPSPVKPNNLRGMDPSASSKAAKPAVRK